MGDRETSKQSEESKVSQKKVGATCDIKRLKRVYENDSYKIKEDSEYVGENKDKYHPYALISTQNFDSKNRPTTKTLRINSPHLLSALASVVKYYPSHRLGFEEPIEIESPFELLYHHEQELSERKAATDDGVAQSHLNLLLECLQGEPGASAAELIKTGAITFKLLWAIFKPGNLLYTIENGHKRLYWLRSSSYYSSWSNGEYFQLNCSYQAWDGSKTGQADAKLLIYQDMECPGNNPVRITSLSVSPLNHHANAKEIEIELSQRGKDYMKLRDRCVHKYEGLCMRLKVPPRSEYYPDEDNFSGVWLPQTVSILNPVAAK